eukprot:TRINITY_DN15999_c0_g1_i3.p1 TRINITY_DN15999_c0_g1~~TRINITY_DN15999_c0_g1_i3.p1  ORF type:complete len:637 (-),score=120.16 TRINITY_DN15999_c0_g1_i3:287-2197(-)
MPGKQMLQSLWCFALLASLPWLAFGTPDGGGEKEGGACQAAGHSILQRKVAKQQDGTASQPMQEVLTSSDTGTLSLRSHRSSPPPASIAQRIQQDPKLVQRAAAMIGSNDSTTGEIINEAIAGAIDSLGGIVVKWMTGQSVSKEEYIDLAKNAITTGLNIATGFLTAAFPVFAPLISFVASIFQKLIDLFFGWLFPEPPEPSTGQLIKAALAKYRMNQNRDFWEGFSDELRWMPGLFAGPGQEDAKLSWYLVLQHDLATNKNMVFHSACLQSTRQKEASCPNGCKDEVDLHKTAPFHEPQFEWMHDDCKDWLKDGMWEIMLPYAELHMTVLWEITEMTMTNPDTQIYFKKTQTEILVKRMRQLGTEYVNVLKDAWNFYYPYRMSLIWDQSHRDYAWSQSEYYHPFDFLHANVDQGFDKLDLEMPVKEDPDDEKDPTAHREIDQVRRWKYQGCEGPRHDDVMKKNNAKKPNNACNLYHHITSAQSEGGCGCAPGGGVGKKWFDTEVSESARNCWKQCMTEYIAEADKDVKKGFKSVIDKLQGLIDKLDFPTTFKFDLQKDNTECEPKGVIIKEKCLEGFKALGVAVTGGLHHESSPHYPLGCFLKGDSTAVYNSGTSGSAQAGSRPLCGAEFISAHV